MKAPENTPLAGAEARLADLINWERRDRTAGMGRTLEPVQDLLTRLGDPHRAWRSVQVAGTKGKGSVSALVAAALESAGLPTGVYASPHVERVNERVRCGGVEIGDEAFANALHRALDERDAAAKSGSPASDATWFDVMTAAAFLCFRDEGMAWAVVECGLGGRLDSTSAITEEVAVVTNVDLEHTAVLGDTRAAIAAEKGAILSPGGVLVAGLTEGDEAAAVLAQIAAQRGGRLRLVPPRGDHRSQNRNLARAVLDELGALGYESASGERLSAAHLTPAVIEAARLPGRWEAFEVAGVPVHLDCAHVASSLDVLLGELSREPGHGALPQLVLALGRDKQHQALLKTLVGRVDRVLCTTSTSGPLLGAGELAQLAQGHGLDALAVDDARDALRRALERAAGKGWVFVVGSFYLAGEVRGDLLREDTSRSCSPSSRTSS